jgi:uncharacterized protein (TIGR04255 family)
LHARPHNLPEFQRPPLVEVALGVQFKPPRGYSQIRAGEVWRLFQDSFPIVEEKAFLPPAFEVFGLPQRSQMQLNIASGPSHDRFWFLSPTGNELIQFQADRLHHNWRKLENNSHYPRFDSIVEAFRSELHKLQSYFSSLGSDTLVITQFEATYVNQISVPKDEKFGDWVRFISGDIHFDDISIMFRRVIYSQSSQPLGRLVCEAASSIDEDGEPMLTLNITIRGKPSTSSIEHAIESLWKGREAIVLLFTEVTTERAHEMWGRAK